MSDFSTFFIKRPIAATLLMMAVVLCGTLAFFLLPISPLPQVDLATIQVRASLPGASPEVMASTVATPLERNLGSISGVSEITSSSSQGSTNVTLQFDLTRDINGAANDVQAALNATQSSLPSAMRSKPTYRKANPANAPIMILSLQSGDMSQGQLYDYANNVLLQRILQTPGVGDVTVGGSSPQAVRVDLNPKEVAHMGVSLNSIVTAIGNANTNLPQGRIEGGNQSWQIKSDTQTRHSSDFMPLIVSYKDGNAVRLADIATVTDTVQNPLNMAVINGKPGVLMIVTSAPNANIIDTVDKVKASLPQLRGLIPADVNLGVVMERTATIRGSIHDVERSLVISLILVILVVFLFLRRWRATLIPSVAIPVSLIGTFAVMYVSGFSLNNLSLMSLTIATGFVVDDAIVVLENISRHIEEGMSPMAAAYKGSKEIGFTVLSMSISLIAVFIPFLGMSDLVGRFFREFALTLTCAIVISMFLSLTVTPMMCARGLRMHNPEQRENIVLRVFSKILARVEASYSRGLDWAINHGRWMLLVLFSAIALTAYLFITLPKGFFPEQDTGRINAQIRIDQSASFEANQTQLLKAMNIIAKDPAVAQDGVAGFVSGRSARLFIALKPLNERTDAMKVVLARLRKATSNLAGADVLYSATQDISIGGRAAPAAYQYTLQSDSAQDLSTWSKQLTQALSQRPEFKDVNTDLNNNGVETQIHYDKDAMVRQGITVKSVDTALYAAFGPRLIGTIYDPLSTRQVLLGLPLDESQNANDLDNIFVLNSANVAIPLSAFATWQSGKAPVTINHQSGTPAGTVSFNLAAGASLSDAEKLIDQTRITIGMPGTVRGAFAGTAKAYAQNQNQQLYLILMVVVCIYIVLGVLYESFVHPLTILSTIPSASLGALMALWVTGGQFDLIGLIGVLLLIGLVKKNAIMMIDYAIKAQRHDGLDAKAAIAYACRLRFRPILMTSLAAICGAIPLALGHGDGAELRQPLGIAIVGGLVVSQLMTLFTTPVIFIYFDRFAKRWHPFHQSNTDTISEVS